MPNAEQPMSAVVKAHMRQGFYATKPTSFTLFLRTFLPWQVYRFLRINLKMVQMIRLSHRSH